ncbi:hypothetical protein [Curtobacterium sp. NPDC089689]|uniref:hypothetical protein n=1 Tax=Curtobacterium sp. NPDC089689 TaxID=3363968 RepID=UPI00381194A0
MNPALYEQLGVRNSLGAFAGLLLAVAGTGTLLLGVWSIAEAGVTDQHAVFESFGSAIVALGRSTGNALDALSGMTVTVILGFYIAIIGGQLAPGLDVVSLRRRLSGGAQVLAASFCGVVVLRIVFLVAAGSVGSVIVTVLETILVVALAVETSSWMLLSRRRQLEQNQRELERSRERIRQAAEPLRDPLRKRPVLASVGAIAVSAAPSLCLAVAAPGASPLFAPLVVGLVLGAHGAFLFVHYARVAEGLRWLAWILPILPTVFGSLVVLSGLQLIAVDRPVAGAAVLSSFLMVALVELCAWHPALSVLSLRHLAVRLELAEALASRRKALRRAVALAKGEDSSDESALLDWLRRS